MPDQDGEAALVKLKMNRDFFAVHFIICEGILMKYKEYLGK